MDGWMDVVGGGWMGWMGWRVNSLFFFGRKSVI